MTNLLDVLWFRIENFYIIWSLKAFKGGYLCDRSCFGLWRDYSVRVIYVMKQKGDISPPEMAYHLWSYMERALTSCIHRHKDFDVNSRMLLL